MNMTTPTDRLAFLRIQVYAAMQQTEGEEQAAFWELIDEINALRPLADD